MATTRPVVPEAYEAYLQGRYWAGKFSEESYRKAQGYFERAVAIDTSFAPAWASLGEIHQKLGYFFADLDQRLAQTESALDRALSLDPQLAAAHALRGDYYVARWNWAESEKSIQRALELEPGSALSHLNYWRLLTRLRRFDEGQREIETALRLDPLSANIAANYGFQLNLVGRDKEALEQYRMALELEPDFGLVHSYAWMYYHRQKKDPERGVELRGWLSAFGMEDLVPEFERRESAGGYEKALLWLANELDAQSSKRMVRLGIAAGLLACAGENDRAMAWLERGFEKRDWELGWIAVSQDYDSLRDRADFQELLRKLKLPAPTS